MSKTYTINGDSEVSTVVDPNFNHITVGVSYFTDDTYTTIASPSAGTLAIQGRVNGNFGWSDLVGSPLDCTDNSASANTSTQLQEIRAVPTSLDAGVYFKVTITGNNH